MEVCILFDNVVSKLHSYNALVEHVLFYFYFFLKHYPNVLQLLMNVDIDAEPSKLHEKEVRNSMSGGWRGGISLPKTQFTKANFFIQLSIAIFTMPQRVSYDDIIITN